MGKVIKSMDAKGREGSVSPMDLTDIALFAHSLKSDAEKRAKSIIVTAWQAKEQIKAGAYKSGFAKGYEEGLAKGKDEGMKTGTEAAVQQVKKESAELSNLLQKLASDIEEKRKYVSEDARKDLVELAIRVAEKIAGREIEMDPEFLRANIEQAIELTVRKSDIEIRLNPVDSATVNRFLPEIRKKYSEINSAKIIEDPVLARGSCLVRSCMGEVDATLDSQLENLRNVLLKGK